MDLAIYALAAVLAYLVGSIPTGFLIARSRGIDIRTVGSGNIGATNAMRVLGPVLGSVVLLIDLLKGYVGCAGVALLLHRTLGQAPPTEPVAQSLLLVSGIAVVLGHNFTCWLRFRGGKGIATSAGVLLALMPLALGISAIVWAVTFLLSRIVSLASMAAALALPLAVWFTVGDEKLLALAVLLALLALYRHRANIQRLLAGTEHRFKKPDQSA